MIIMVILLGLDIVKTDKKSEKKTCTFSLFVQIFAVQSS